MKNPHPATRLHGTVGQIRLAAEKGTSSKDTATELSISIITVQSLAQRHGIVFQGEGEITASPEPAPPEPTDACAAQESKANTDSVPQRAAIERTVPRGVGTQPGAMLYADGLFWPSGVGAIGIRPEYERTCSICHCTESRCCPFPCEWVGPTLCDNCQEIRRLVLDVCVQPSSIGPIQSATQAGLVTYCLGKVRHCNDPVRERVTRMVLEDMGTRAVVRRAVEQLVSERLLLRQEGKPVTFLRRKIRQRASAVDAPVPETILNAVARAVQRPAKKPADVPPSAVPPTKKPSRATRAA